MWYRDSSLCVLCKKEIRTGRNAGATQAWMSLSMAIVKMSISRGVV